MTNKAFISTDKSRLDIAKIHHYITHTSYWGKGRTLAQVQRSIEHSVCFGVYIENEQIGFARVISDHVAFAYLMDVIIFEEYQGNGYGTLLMQAIINYEPFSTVNWLLKTADAQPLYQKFGFTQVNEADLYMKKTASNSE